MNREQAGEYSTDLVGRCQTVLVGSIGDEGYPNIKAMFKMETEGLRNIWFSTNTSSQRVAQFKKNSKACVYFIDTEKIMGLMLVGNMEILEDRQAKERLWREGFERYYPLGVTDPDYCVLRFCAKRGNFYHGLENISFQI